jgi:DNA-binding NtrC family response regulator
VTQVSDERPFDVLLIDDDPSIAVLLNDLFSIAGVKFHAAQNATEGLALVERLQPQLILLDLGLPDLNGMEVLDVILRQDPNRDVIVLTGLMSTSAAVEAINRGASDYITKPIDLDELLKKLGDRAQREIHLDFPIPSTTKWAGGFIGRDPSILTIFGKIDRMAVHFRTVLISGETGTGKDLIAHALHRASGAAGQFVICNCAAVVETLFESELFGYQRGAFTGAVQDKVGLVEYADGGTLFLDEVGELPLATQAKLLRVLQNREIQRIGSLKPKKVDVRVVAATNRDLRTMVRSGHFREDLFFRFALIELKMPRLSERVGDLPLLENHFLDKFAGLYGTPRQRLSRRARLAFKRYSWPGNVRELENVLGYCCMMCQKEIIDVSDFPERFRESLVSAGDDLADLTADLVPLEEMRQQYIARVLAQVGGNRVKAAKILRIGRTSLHRYLKES